MFVNILTAKWVPRISRCYLSTVGTLYTEEPASHGTLHLFNWMPTVFAVIWGFKKKNSNLTKLVCVCVCKLTRSYKFLRKKKNIIKGYNSSLVRVKQLKNVNWRVLLRSSLAKFRPWVQNWIWFHLCSIEGRHTSLCRESEGQLTLLPMLRSVYPHGLTLFFPTLFYFFLEEIYPCVRATCNSEIAQVMS